MQAFPCSSLEELKASCPSRAAGRTWKAELAYRRDCVALILACGPPIKLAPTTLHRAVVLLHRYLTRYPSTAVTGMRKWALATACVFLATKVDSAYHRLESVVHVSFRALRASQGRPLEAEYYAPNGTPGSPAFLAQLCELVRDAELALIFAVNFDFNVEVPAALVVLQLGELGLTEAAGEADAAVMAARAAAMAYAQACVVAQRCVAVLQHPARHLALAAICAACRAHGVSVDPSRAPARGYTPHLTPQQLAAVEQCLPKLGSAVSGGSGGTTGRAITPPSSSGCADTGDARSDGQQPRPVPAAAVTGQGHKQCSGGVPSTPGSGGSGAATSTHMHAIGGGGSGSGAGAGTGGGSAGAPARGGGAAGCAVLSREEGGGAGGARAAQSTLQLSPDSTTGPAGPLLPVLPSAIGGGPLHSLAAQQQQQQQCHKRRREDGDLAQVLLLGSDAQRSRKEGGMVVA